jgi:hypothetical protein
MNFFLPFIFLDQFARPESAARFHIDANQTNGCEFVLDIPRGIAHANDARASQSGCGCSKTDIMKITSIELLSDFLY